MSEPTTTDADTSAAEIELLTAPRDGTPAPLTTRDELAVAVAALAAADGPVAVDAERASGYRYSQRAYLVQLRRAGAGTFLIDPIALPDLADVNEALAEAEWILHAANQDLPCLAELGLRPNRLFDTELVGRLLGSERVALATMLEQYLNMSLEKGHSAADWSTRPLPHDWLVYAALDVELLIELRVRLLEELARTGKLAWAEQECRAILDAPPPAPRADPWRRTSGIHGLRNRRQLAMVRSLWTARDKLAARRDVAPGRTLPDSAIIAAVRASPRTEDELIRLDVYGGSRQRRQAAYWFSALSEGRGLDEAELPPLAQHVADPDSMPAQSRWRDRDPDAAARLAACKEVVSTIAERHQVVGQNLLAGDTTRRLAWRSVAPLTEDAVRTRLADLGAREWQIELLAAALVPALATVAATPSTGDAAPAANDTASPVDE